MVANFVIVEGQLVIGTENKQFSQKAIIELTPNKKRSPYSYTSTPPADRENPRDLGYKSFVVVRMSVQSSPSCMFKTIG